LSSALHLKRALVAGPSHIQKPCMAIGLFAKLPLAAGLSIMDAKDQYSATVDVCHKTELIV
jgi:hypothetical protein